MCNLGSRGIDIIDEALVEKYGATASQSADTFEAEPCRHGVSVAGG